jgi:hypothetical protein
MRPKLYGPSSRGSGQDNELRLPQSHVFTNSPLRMDHGARSGGRADAPETEYQTPIHQVHTTFARPRPFEKLCPPKLGIGGIQAHLRGRHRGFHQLVLLRATLGLRPNCGSAIQVPVTFFYSAAVVWRSRTCDNPATTLLDSRRGSGRHVSGFVQTRSSSLRQIVAFSYKRCPVVP